MRRSGGRSVRALRPEQLEEASLPEAIGTLARTWSKGSMIDAGLETTGTGPIQTRRRPCSAPLTTKLGVRDRASAVATAYKRGLLG